MKGIILMKMVRQKCLFSSLAHFLIGSFIFLRELQHARLPYPSLSPGICSNSVSIESVMPSKHLIFCHSLLLLPSVFISIGVCFSELALHIRWPKCWSFSFSIGPSDEYLGSISFRIDWFDFLGIQGIHSQESSPAELPNPEIEPGSPALAGRIPTGPSGKLDS